MFKVGDIVIGCGNNNYGVTGLGVKCIITGVPKEGTYLELRVPDRKDPYEKFIVNPRFFKLFNKKSHLPKWFNNKDST